MNTEKETHNSTQLCDNYVLSKPIRLCTDVIFCSNSQHRSAKRRCCLVIRYSYKVDSLLLGDWYHASVRIKWKWRIPGLWHHCLQDLISCGRRIMKLSSINTSTRQIWVDWSVSACQREEFRSLHPSGNLTGTICQSVEMCRLLVI